MTCWWKVPIAAYPRCKLFVWGDNPDSKKEKVHSFPRRCQFKSFPLLSEDFNQNARQLYVRFNFQSSGKWENSMHKKAKKKNIYSGDKPRAFVCCFDWEFILDVSESMQFLPQDLRVWCRRGKTEKMRISLSWKCSLSSNFSSCKNNNTLYQFGRAQSSKLSESTAWEYRFYFEREKRKESEECGKKRKMFAKEENTSKPSILSTSVWGWWEVFNSWVSVRCANRQDQSAGNVMWIKTDFTSALR